MRDIKQAANIITTGRLAAAAALIFIKPFTAAFYAVYIFGGVTDMIDGVIARKLRIENKYGERLDSIADLCFVIVCAVKCLSKMNIAVWIWVWIGVIAAVRILNIILAKICLHEFFILHTAANKAAGLLLFLFPLMLPFTDLRISAAVVCSVATFAAVQEGYFIRISRK